MVELLKTLRGNYWVRLAFYGVLFWLGLFVTFAVAAILDQYRSGREADILRVLVTYGVSFGHWLFITPPLLHFSSSARFLDATIISKAWQSLALLVVSMLVVLLYLFLVATPVFGQSFSQMMDSIRFVQWIWDFVLYGVVVLVGYQLAVSRRNREVRIKAAELGQRLAEQQADLSAREAEYLRGRLGSHFVMNALSNLVGLMRLGYVRRAEEATILLSEILRSMTGASGTEECIPLSDEVEDARKYLSFQQIRFPELKASFDVAGDVAGFCVPRQILQPLLENVFKHGPRGGSIEVSVKAEMVGACLDLMVENNLADETADTVSEGEGMQLTKMRLQMAHGEAASLARAASGRKYRVTVRIPHSEGLQT